MVPRSRSVIPGRAEGPGPESMTMMPGAVMLALVASIHVLNTTFD